MSVFNLKDARAEEYIKSMVRLYPSVWSGFGEIVFKKQEFSENIAGGPPSLYSPSIDAIFDVTGEMGAAAVVHCDHDTPYNLALLSREEICGPGNSRTRRRSNNRDAISPDKILFQSA